MSTSTVTRFKVFFAHQDREQERWLRAMALQGLHLHSLNAFCFWTFVKGQPADVAYRLDFNNGQASGYRQLFEDAGWELAAHVTGWQYWRKTVVDGREPEIHTDRQSKIEKFQRVLSMLVVAAMPLLVMIILSWNRPEMVSKLPAWIAVTVGAILTVHALAALALFRRIRQVRNEGA
jgi:hypothetical protein